MKVMKVLFAICLLGSVCSSFELESVSDDDLIHLIKKESYVIVFFSKKNCDDCDNLETNIIQLYDDFKDTLGAVVVKAFNSQLTRLYNPSKEPALVFFRHGVPLLYDGPNNDDAILQNFSENKDPIVKELSDENFEHLTQASTGATTGDWFIMFYTQECVDCQRLSAVWEAVGAALKTRMNVARINKGSVGSKTANRLKIKKVPEFVFIRQGKYYKYEINKFDVKSFVTFAQEWYKNSSPHKVPVPETPFDNIISMGANALKISIDIGGQLVTDHPYFALCIAVGFGLTILTAIIALFKSKKSKGQSKKKKAK